VTVLGLHQPRTYLLPGDQVVVVRDQGGAALRGVLAQVVTPPRVVHAQATAVLILDAPTPGGSSLIEARPRDLLIVRKALK
jgi:hypothetical protein